MKNEDRRSSTAKPRSRYPDHRHDEILTRWRHRSPWWQRKRDDDDDGPPPSPVAMAAPTHQPAWV